MAIVLGNPNAQLWSGLGSLLGQALGYFGTSYLLNRDLLNQMAFNTIDQETYNALIKTLGQDLVNQFVRPTEQGFVIDLDTLGQLIQSSDNPVLNKIYNVATARKKFSKRNLLSKLLEIQDPNITMALSLTPSTINKWQEEVKTQNQLKQMLQDQLGVSSEWLDLLTKQPALVYPILLLDLVKRFKGEK